MNETTALQSPGPATSATTSRPLRLKFPFVCLLTFWVLTAGLKPIDKPYFIGFMASLLLTALVSLLFLGWWWFNRGLRIWEKSAGFALMLAEAFLVGKVSDHSITFFTLWVIGLPLVASLVVGWMFLSRRLRVMSLRTGFVLVVSLGWSFFALIRMDGADASLKIPMHWRWTPTAEQTFLAHGRARSTGRGAVDLAGSMPSDRTDWTAFRGPERDGVIVGSTISSNWTAHPPRLVWKHSVGPAWSSVLVVGNALFTQEQRGDKETVVCYNTTTGDQVWVHEDTTRFDESVSGPGPRATPTLASGKLFTVGGTGLLDCLNASDGSVIWSRDIKQDSGAKVPTWAFSGSPLIYGDLVIVYAGGDSGKGLLAYRARSGELAWASAAGTSSYSSPQLTTLCGVPQCLMLHDAGLTAFDPRGGNKLWETGVAMKGAPRCGQPRLIGENRLLVASLGGLGTSLIDVATNSSGWVVHTQWDSKDLKPEFPDFVVQGGYAYGFDIGMFCCLNLADGKRTWKEGRYGRGEVMLLRDQGLLLVSSETGALVLLAADPVRSVELGHFQALDGKTWNHPVVKGDRVFLRNAQELACYRVTDEASK